MNEIYKDELSDKKYLKLNTLSSSKGFCEYSEEVDNDPSATSKDLILNKINQYKRTQSDLSKSFNKKKSNFELKTGHLRLCSPREMYISDTCSNIFFDSEKEKINKTINPTPIEKPKKDTRDLTQPKKCRGAVKWVSKLDWTSKDGALLFRTFNKKIIPIYNGKPIDSSDRSFAYERKKIDMSDSFYSQPYDTNFKVSKKGSTIRLEEQKLNNELNTNIPHKKYESQKIMLKSSCSHLKSYNKTYYDDIEKLKKKTVDTESNDKSYIAKNINRNDLTAYYRKKGIHIYNVNESNPFQKDLKTNTISFKIRQRVDQKKALNSASNELKSQFKDAEILPVKKKINYKKTSIGDNTIKIQNSHLLNNKAEKVLAGDKKNYKQHNEVNSSFSKKFIGLDYRYKNNHKRVKV